MRTAIIVIIALLIVVGVVYAFNRDNVVEAPEGVACTMDAKICPDGSYVGRVAPSCEFAACPGSTSTATSTI